MRYVFTIEGAKRYRFPTHINDIVMDRIDAATSEVLHVVVEPGKATPLHSHHDMEQIYHIIAGKGTLDIGKDGERHAMRPGNVVRIPPHTLHRIACDGDEALRYIAVDCFLSGRPASEPTWEAHVRVICKEQGWAFEDVVG